MKTILLGLTLVCAGVAPIARADVAAVTDPAAAATKAAAVTGAKPQSSRCAPANGSRIRRSANADGTCDRSAYPSRSYSADDLKSTGEVDLGRALEKLDPGFRR